MRRGGFGGSGVPRLITVDFEMVSTVTGAMRGVNNMSEINNSGFETVSTVNETYCRNEDNMKIDGCGLDGLTGLSCLAAIL